MFKSWGDNLQQTIEKAASEGRGIPFVFLGRCTHCGEVVDKKGNHKSLNELSMYERERTLLDDRVCREVISSYNEILRSMPAARALIEQLDQIQIAGG